MDEILYYYTSPQGAFSILKDKTLWFTDCQYLNDRSELIYIREPLKEAYVKIEQERGKNHDEVDQFLDSLFSSPYENVDWEWYRNHRTKPFERLSNLPRYRYYVLCTSINPDTANMWNYYVKDGAYQGYNFGLDKVMITSWFEAFSEHVDYKVSLVEGKVIYNRKKQTEMFYNKLKELLDIFDEKIIFIDEGSDDTPIIDEFQEGLLEYIDEHKLFFKNPAFKCEEEYRFVLKVHNDFIDDIDDDNNGLLTKYRVGTSGIITPFIEWHFDLDTKSELLKQITLSPTMEPELAKESFRRFLAKGVYQNIKIEESSIKLRF